MGMGMAVQEWAQFKHYYNYSQTCSNDHLYKMTTHQRRPMLSPPKQILIQSLLYRTTTCLMQPAKKLVVQNWTV